MQLASLHLSYVTFWELTIGPDNNRKQEETMGFGVL